MSSSPGCTARSTTSSRPRAARTLDDLLDGFVSTALDLGVGDARPIVLAVSGGPDSVALLHLAHRAARATGWRLRVAHLDHALRPGSGADAEFVAGLAERLGIPVTVRRTDVAALAGERGDGLEAAGRAARYAFLDELLDDAGADALAMTAHTLDDQAETVLLSLVRGSGPAGLAGIAPRRDRIVRPLLAVRRGDLRAALDAEEFAYVLDPSNSDRRFARNRLRFDLLPLLESLHPGAAAGIARTASRSAADEAALVALAAAALASRRDADGWLDWRSPPPDAIGSRILRLAVGSPAPSAERIAALLHAACGPGGGRSIELGRGRWATVRRHRVRILHRP